MLVCRTHQQKLENKDRQITRRVTIVEGDGRFIINSRAARCQRKRWSSCAVVSKLKRATIGGSLRHNSVLVLAHIYLHRCTQPPNYWLHERCFHSPSVYEINVVDEVISPDVLNGFLGFLVVDPLSHNIFP